MHTEKDGSDVKKYDYFDDDEDDDDDDDDDIPGKTILLVCILYHQAFIIINIRVATSPRKSWCTKLYI